MSWAGKRSFVQTEVSYLNGSPMADISCRFQEGCQSGNHSGYDEDGYTAYSLSSKHEVADSRRSNRTCGENQRQRLRGGREVWQFWNTLSAGKSWIAWVLLLKHRCVDQAVSNYGSRSE